jgi:predicted GIY-YIG superfamily endonuclease
MHALQMLCPIFLLISASCISVATCKSQRDSDGDDFDTPRPYYQYTLSLRENKLYVGSSGDPVRRIQAHMDGRGAKVTAETGVVSVLEVRKFRSKAEAKRAETKEYMRLRDKHGRQNVRGAGNTARFSKSNARSGGRSRRNRRRRGGSGSGRRSGSRARRR